MTLLNEHRIQSVIYTHSQGLFIPAVPGYGSYLLWEENITYFSVNKESANRESPLTEYFLLKNIQHC